ncbi:MAG: alkaline phosphatase family protein [Syntrophobacteraceae bacterium]
MKRRSFLDAREPALKGKSEFRFPPWALPLFCRVAVTACAIWLWAAPARAGNGSDVKLLVLEFHGLKQSVIEDNLDVLPSFRELIHGQDGTQSHVYFSRVLTTLPAASQPAVTSMYTGRYPCRTGVVSSVWLDRESVGVCTLISYGQQRINRILQENRVKNVFEYFSEAGKRSMTSMLMVTNGVEWPIRSGAFFWGNSAVAGRVCNGRWIPHARYVDEKTMQGFLTGHRTAYRKSLTGVYRREGIVPDLMVVQLLGTDLHSHYPLVHPDAFDLTMAGIQRYYAQAVLDPLVGDLLGTLKSLGIYDRTIVLLVSEQGFSLIHKQVQNRIVDDSLKGVFHLPGFLRSSRGADAVVMPGAGTKEIYLKNRAAGDWMHPPRLLADVKPAIDRLLADSEVRDATEALLVAQYPGERSEGIEETDRWWVLDEQTYGTGDRSSMSFLASLKPLSELRYRFELGEYLATGLRHQYNRRTMPDIKLVTPRGVYFEGDFDKVAHHGSFYPDDCLVSFWIAGPGLSRVLPGRHRVQETASTLDLVPILAYLAGLPPPEGLDGRNPLANLPHSED